MTPPTITDPGAESAPHRIAGRAVEHVPSPAPPVLPASLRLPSRWARQAAIARASKAPDRRVAMERARQLDADLSTAVVQADELRAYANRVARTFGLRWAGVSPRDVVAADRAAEAAEQRLRDAVEEFERLTGPAAGADR